MKSRKLELFICISCGIAVIGFIFFTTKPSELAKALSELSVLPLLAAVLCMVFYWLGEILTVHILLKKHFRDQKFGDSVCIRLPAVSGVLLVEEGQGRGHGGQRAAR